MVTGANGFVGKHLCNALHRAEFAVAPYVRNRHDARGWSLDHIAMSLEAHKPDVVFHLAGATTGDVATMQAANVEFATCLLAAIDSTQQAPLVIVAGSAAEYGPVQTDGGALEESAVCRPMSDYGRTKLQQTELVLSWAKASGRRAIVARIANPVGAGMSPSLAVGSFCAQVAAMPQSGGVLSVGDIESERDFMAVEDTAAQLIGLATVPTAGGQIVNVCSGVPTRVSTFVSALQDLSGKNFSVLVDPARLRSGSPQVLFSSAARLRALGIRPVSPDPVKMVRAAYSAYAA